MKIRDDYKSKATSESHPHIGPVSIRQAYEELTPPEFSVWMRLMVEQRDALKMGRNKLARLLGYSERWSNIVLRGLYLKGYIAFVRHGPGLPTEVIIARRALISARDGFVRMSCVLREYDQIPPHNRVQPLLPKAPVASYPRSAAVTHGRSRCYPRRTFKSQ